MNTGMACDGVTNRARTGDIRNHNLVTHGSNCLQGKKLRQRINLVAPTVAPANQKCDKSDGSVSDSNHVPITKPEPVSKDFAAALVMIASLPLSDAEKAEAVRRLLGSN